MLQHALLDFQATEPLCHFCSRCEEKLRFHGEHDNDADHAWISYLSRQRPLRCTSAPRDIETETTSLCINPVNVTTTECNRAQTLSLQSNFQEAEVLDELSCLFRNSYHDCIYTDADGSTKSYLKPQYSHHLSCSAIDRCFSDTSGAASNTPEKIPAAAPANRTRWHSLNAASPPKFATLAASISNAPYQIDLNTSLSSSSILYGNAMGEGTLAAAAKNSPSENVVPLLCGQPSIFGRDPAMESNLPPEVDRLPSNYDSHISNAYDSRSIDYREFTDDDDKSATFRRTLSSTLIRRLFSFMVLPLILTSVILAPRSAQGFLEYGQGSQDEERLVRDLFREYNVLIRPVKSMDVPLVVEFGLALVLLISVNEKDQVMKTNVWLHLQWNDFQLKWDPSKYGGITSIRLPQDKVWTPDIVLFNNFDGNYRVSYKSNVVLYHYGNVLWVPPSIYKSTCEIEVRYFPFDYQTCKMTFKSWTFNANEVNLTYYKNLNHVDLNDYFKSGTWTIVSVPAKLNYDPTSNPPSVDITYHITIRRKTLFYTVNLLIPTVLVSFLSVLVFYLPTDAGEKVTLSISILLSLVVFLLLVSKILPPSAKLPLIAQFLLFTFVMNIFSILATVIIINLNYRGPTTHQMPRWVRRLFLEILPFLLAMKRPAKRRAVPFGSHGGPDGGSGAGGMADARGRGNVANDVRGGGGGAASQRLIGNNISAGGGGDAYELSDFSNRANSSGPSRSHLGGPTLAAHRRASAQFRNERGVGEHDLYNDDNIGGGGAPAGGDDFLMISPELHQVAEAVDFISEHLRNEDEEKEIEEDWRYVALVIDRLLLWVFFLVTLAGSLSILMSAENMFKQIDEDKVIADFSDTT